MDNNDLTHLEDLAESAETVASKRAGQPDAKQWRYIADKRRREHEKAKERKKMVDLLGRTIYTDLIEPSTGKTICKSGQRITLEIAQAIRAAGMLDGVRRFCNVRVVRPYSRAEEEYFEYQDMQYEEARLKELEDYEE